MDGSTETLEQMQARHRKEAKEMQGRITNKKKNATKKTRKGINDECAELERAMKERQAEEIRKLQGESGDAPPAEEEEEEEEEQEQEQGLNGKMQTMGLEDDVAAAKSPPAAATTATTSSPNNSASNNDAEATGAGAGAGGKKRNRQKDRLARRAAEQEAAARRAEEEAAHMTDHRAIEKTYMRAEFARHGLDEHEIRPDGHCLFSAVADQLGQLGVPLLLVGGGGEEKEEKEEKEKEEGDGDGDGDGEKAGTATREPGYKIVRRRAAEYILAHGDQYAGFLDEDLGAYARRIRDTAEWGGQVELSALANVYGVEIRVVQDRDTEVIGPTIGAGAGAAAKDGKEEERKRIWLAYYRHGYGLGEHYNSLRRKG